MQTQAFASRQISTIRHDFELGESFSLAWSDEKHTSGTGTLEGFGKVVCLEMQIANTTRTFIDIYRDIQEGAFVQRCLGILRNEKKYYVVMEDLEPQLNLAEAISKDRLPESIVSRLNLVYDLAKTMAWYHRAQLLLKSVSDRSVVLRTLPSGDVCPVVTGVENSRHVSSFIPISDILEADIQSSSSKLRNRSTMLATKPQSINSFGSIHTTLIYGVWALSSGR